MHNLDDYNLVEAYPAEYRGIVNAICSPRTSGDWPGRAWGAETSMLKTLAAKHRSTVSKTAAKFKGDGRNAARASDLLLSTTPMADASW
jgi:hypothetical protein